MSDDDEVGNMFGSQSVVSQTTVKKLAKKYNIPEFYNY